jgi:hypothetical protein
MHTRVGERGERPATIVAHERDAAANAGRVVRDGLERDDAVWVLGICGKVSDRSQVDVVVAACVERRRDCHGGCRNDHRRTQDTTHQEGRALQELLSVEFIGHGGISSVGSSSY